MTYVFDSAEAESNAQQAEFQSEDDLKMAKEFIATFKLVDAVVCAEKVAENRWHKEGNPNMTREEWIEFRSGEIIDQMIAFIKK